MVAPSAGADNIAVASACASTGADPVANASDDAGYR